MFRQVRFPCPRPPGSRGVWCPWCYENMRGRAAHVGHAHCYRRSPPRALAKEFVVQRPNPPKPPKKGEFSCPDDEFREGYPLLAAGLSDLWWDDGKPRRPWTLKVAFSPDSVQVTTSDPDSKLVCFTTASTLSGCFDAIEVALANGGLSWRKSKY